MGSRDDAGTCYAPFTGNRISRLPGRSAQEEVTGRVLEHVEELGIQAQLAESVAEVRLRSTSCTLGGKPKDMGGAKHQGKGKVPFRPSLPLRNGRPHPPGVCARKVPFKYG